MLVKPVDSDVVAFAQRICASRPPTHMSRDEIETLRQDGLFIDGPYESLSGQPYAPREITIPLIYGQVESGDVVWAYRDPSDEQMAAARHGYVDTDQWREFANGERGVIHVVSGDPPAGNGWPSQRVLIIPITYAPEPEPNPSSDPDG